MYWYYILGLILGLILMHDLINPHIKLKEIEKLSQFIQHVGLHNAMHLAYLMIACFFVGIVIFLLVGLQPLLH